MTYVNPLPPANAIRHDYVCATCGTKVLSYVFWNYRKIPPELVKPDRCEACRAKGITPETHGRALTKRIDNLYD